MLASPQSSAAPAVALHGERHTVLRRGMLRRPALLIVAGLLFAAALFVVVLNVETPDRSAPARGAPPPRVDDDIAELARSMTAITRKEVEDASRNFRDQDISVEEGGWINLFDENNRLIQMYRADGVDPKASGVIEMKRPEALFFLKDGRVVVLRAERGTVVQGTGRRLETGRLFDRVRVQIFDPDEGQPVNFDADPPDLLIRAAEVEFDSTRGEIISNGVVNVQAAGVDFHGAGLFVLFDEKTGLQRLVVERQTEIMRLRPSALASREESGDGTESPDVDRPRPDTPRAPREKDQSTKKSAKGPAEDQFDDLAEPAPFYRAVFYDRVRVSRYDGTQVIEGDELRLIFSLDNKEVGDQLSSRSAVWSAEPDGGAAIQSLRDIIAASIVATIRQDDDGRETDIVLPPDQEDVYLTFAGRMEINPVRDETLYPPTADDMRLEIVGRPVRIRDVSHNVSATCGSLTYDSAGETIALHGVALAPLSIVTPDLAASGEQLRYHTASKRAEFIGPGTMRLNETRDDSATERAANAESHSGADEHDRLINIFWSDGADIAFISRQENQTEGEPESGDRLHEATFTGDVNVSEERFEMLTERLRIAFDEPAADGSDNIREIEATDSVVVRGLGQKGGLVQGRHLLAAFERDEDDQTGRTAPRTIQVTGDVLAKDDEQEVRAERMIVDLVKTAQDGAAWSPDAPADAEGPRAGFDEMQVRSARAEENVEITLPGGVTATGNLLVADASGNTADLTGEEVILKGRDDRVDITARGTHARVERGDDVTVIRMPGAGDADIIELPPQKNAEEMAETGSVETDGSNALTTIDVNWTDQLVYRERENDPRATLDLFGDVKAFSTSSLEENSIESAELGFVFDRPTDETETPGSARGEGHQDDTPKEDRNPDRSLRHVIAMGDVAIEGSVWQTPQRTDEPRRVFIRGGHVEHDHTALESRVYGPGQLLIVDNRPPEQAEKGLTGRGSTVFEWAAGMTMRQTGADDAGLRVYRVRMDGDVSMRHLGIDRQIATLVCETMIVTLMRGGGGAAEPDSNEAPAALDFGGSAEVVQFSATGGVHLEGHDRIVDGEVVHYDRQTGVAEILGSASRDAVVRTEDSVTPSRARKIIWHLKEDRLEMFDVRGSIPRGGGG